MEEAFFNKDFWRQLVAVFVGAFLGFGGALAAGQIFAARRRQTLARMTRLVVVREAIENLVTLRQMDRLTRLMRREGFAVARFSTQRPRAEILQQFMSPESLAALSEEEARFLMVIPPQLAYLNEQYEEYQGLLHRLEDALAPVEVEGTGTVPYRELVTDRLLGDVALLGSNLVGILAKSGHRVKARLVDDEDRELVSKLGGPTFGRGADYLKVFKSSMVKDHKELDPKKCLVVWEHDWAECPMPVVELRPRRTEWSVPSPRPGPP